jgi:PAS domain S-box-containing protein
MDNLFQALAKAADGAFVVNEDQYILYWNEAAQELLGYTAAKVVGQACYETMRSCDEKGQSLCRPHCPVITAALEGQTVTTYDVAVQTQSGEMRWINISILTIYSPGDDSGPLVVHLFRDATQKKQNEQFIRGLFDSSERPPAITSLTHPVASIDSLVELLTDREREVLTLLAHGLSTSAIARSLSISPATVRNHVQSILNKLQVHSRLEAVTYALDHKLIPKA